MLTDKELTPTERRLVDMVDKAGDLVLDLRTRDREADHPRNAADWRRDREIRAELLAGLLTGERQAPVAHARPFVLAGVRLTGTLDLRQATLIRPLALVACKVDQPIELSDARTPTISLYGCHINGLSAQRTQVGGNVNLRLARCAGQVDLMGARIDGQLLLGGAELTNHDGAALAADGITVGRGMMCADDTDEALGGKHHFTAEGRLSFIGAHVTSGIHFTGARLRGTGDDIALNLESAVIGGYLNCDQADVTGGISLLHAHVAGSVTLDGSRLSRPGGLALSASGLQVDQDLSLQNGFTAVGEVRLTDAKLGTNLWLGGAKVINAGESALSADRLSVEQDVLGRGLAVDGSVLLGGARVGGIVDLCGARLNNADGVALQARSLSVGQYMLCEQEFTVDGETNLTEARVGGSLSFSGARLNNGPGVALQAPLLDITGDLLCNDGFHAVGQVYLVAARVGGTLRFDGAKIEDEGHVALFADSIHVGRCLFGLAGFEVRGEMNIIGAKLEELNLRGARLRNPGKDALSARGIEVNQDVQLTGLSTTGNVSMPRARIGGRLSFDEAELTGTAADKVDLSGATATALSFRLKKPPAGVVDLTNAKVVSYDDDPAGWPERLALRGFTYDVLTNDTVTVRQRLAWVARHEGGFVPGPYDQLAASYRRTGHVEDARRVAYAKLRRRRRVVAWPGKVWNVLLQGTVGYGYHPWRAALWLLGLLAAGSVVFSAAYPVDLVAARAPVPDFQPVAYTLDTLLPIDLGQQSAWLAQGTALACSWVLVIAGWILAAMVIAGVTNALKRD